MLEPRRRYALQDLAWDYPVPGSRVAAFYYYHHNRINIIILDIGPWVGGRR